MSLWYYIVGILASIIIFLRGVWYWLTKFNRTRLVSPSELIPPMSDPRVQKAEAEGIAGFCLHSCLSGMIVVVMILIGIFGVFA